MDDLKKKIEELEERIEYLERKAEKTPPSNFNQPGSAYDLSKRPDLVRNRNKWGKGKSSCSW